jgi:hypothetical protein
MTEYIPEQTLLAEISALVEQVRATVVAQANHTATRLYWQIGTMSQYVDSSRRTYGIRQTDCVDAGDMISLAIFRRAFAQGKYDLASVLR